MYIKEAKKKTEKKLEIRNKKQEKKRPLVPVLNTKQDQRPAGLRAQYFAARTDLWSRLVLLILQE